MSAVPPPKSSTFSRWGLPVLSLGSVLILWQLVSMVSGLGDYILPSPALVAATLVGDAPVWGVQLGSTLVLTVAGFFSSLAAALALGLVLDQFPRLERFFRPLLVLSQTVPAFFLYPLLLIALGFGFLPLLVVVILSCFFPLLVTFVQGLGSTNPDLIDLFRTLGARRWQIVFRVRVPSALPGLFAGLRITLAYALTACVLGEYMGAQRGLGVYMARSFKSFSPAKVLAAIVVVSLLSLVFYQAAAVLETLFLKGKRR
ncbi:MAG TPA: ABC transporter permease [Spirochaetia bacterium]|nr:ABC transporter permease [Spirochaetia bacterium]